MLEYLGKDVAVYSLLHDKTLRKPTFKMPSSSKLQLVKQFLPQLKQDNERILHEIESFPVNKSKYDIENIEKTDEPFIEMVMRIFENCLRTLLTIQIFRNYSPMKNQTVIVIHAPLIPQKPTLKYQEQPTKVNWSKRWKKMKTSEKCNTTSKINN